MSTITRIKNGSTLYDVHDSRLGEMELFTPLNYGKFLTIGVDGSMSLSSFDGTIDYESLTNLPSINGTTFTGNITIPVFANEAVLQATTAAYTTNEKTKLAGIAANANNYVLPQATSNILGGVKLDNTTICYNGDTEQIYVDFTTINDRITSILNNAGITDETTPTTDDTLAKKEYVNISISTSSAIFRGTFEGVYNSDYAMVNPNVIDCSNPLNNDYAFIHIVNPSTNESEYLRFKYVDNTNDNISNGTWNFEYALSNTFDANQWEAINSGITTNLVARIQNYPQATTSTAGVMKLYTATGNNTDGTMTQNAITTAINSAVTTASTTLNNTITALGTRVTTLETSVANLPTTITNATSNKVAFITSSSQPTGAYGVLWYDTRTTPALPKLWNGSAWEALNTWQ